LENGRRGRDRGAADRREAAARRDGGDAEPAAQMPRNALAARNSSRLMPEVVANAPISRNSGTTAKLKSVTVRIGGVADDLERRTAGGEVGKAGDADEAHRHADRHAQAASARTGDEADDRDASVLISTGLASSSGFLISSGLKDQPPGAHPRSEHGATSPIQATA
jgi:hypothetical protein